MPVAFMLDFPDGSLKQYDDVVAKMQLGGQLPPGALFHCAGAGPGGGVRVLDVWESDAAFQAYAEARIRPLSAEAGLLPPEILRFEVENVRDHGKPRGTMTFLQVVRLDFDADAFHSADAEVIAGGLPSGGVYHVNGPLPEGGWIVADGWTSRAARDRFMAERIAPVMQARGATPPAIEDLEVHNTLEPAAAADSMRARIRSAVDAQDAAFNRHDPSGVAAIYSPDAIMHDQAAGEALAGRRSLEEYVGGYLQAFPDFAWERMGLEIDGSIGVEQWRVTGTHDGDLPGLPATHRRVSIEGCSVLHFGDDGLVHEEENYWDEAAMLRQLGAMPQPAATA